MKLEQLTEGPRSTSFEWRNDLTFKSQIRIIRNFLRQTPDSTVAAIYQQAVNDHMFNAEDLKTIRQVMSNHGYSGQDIQALR